MATRTLKLHDEGEDVLELQKQLGLHGFTVQADGVFGKITQSVLKQYQKSKGLEPTGRLDAATRFLLYGGIRLSGGQS